MGNVGKWMYVTYLWTKRRLSDKKKKRKKRRQVSTKKHRIIVKLNKCSGRGWVSSRMFLWHKKGRSSTRSSGKLDMVLYWWIKCSVLGTWSLILITLMRILIQLFISMPIRIRILLFTSMRCSLSKCWRSLRPLVLSLQASILCGHGPPRLWLDSLSGSSFSFLSQSETESSFQK